MIGAFYFLCLCLCSSQSRRNRSQRRRSERYLVIARLIHNLRVIKLKRLFSSLGPKAIAVLMTWPVRCDSTHVTWPHTYCSAHYYFPHLRIYIFLLFFISFFQTWVHRSEWGRGRTNERKDFLVP